jgi:hypothetical protein
LWRRVCLPETLFSPFLKVATMALLLLQNRSMYRYKVLLRLRILSLWTVICIEFLLLGFHFKIMLCNMRFLHVKSTYVVVFFHISIKKEKGVFLS